MTTEAFVEVRTRYGKQGHKARVNEQGVTLCGFLVAHVRVGGSWAPEHPREWDHADECGRCERAVGVGPSS